MQKVEFKHLISFSDLPVAEQHFHQKEHSDLQFCENIKLNVRR